MKTKAKWFGGAAAAAILAFGGVMASSGGLSDPAQDSQASQQAIAVDETVLDASPNELASGEGSNQSAMPQMVSTPVVQEVSAAVDEKPAATKQNERQVIKRILPIEGPLKYGEWHWDDKGVPDGPVVVTVDLEARVISVFKSGYEIGAAAVMLGTDKHPTPLGTFPILWKQRDNVSEKYNNAPMPWSLFLTNDGIAIHGGSTVENGYASHGCIAVPDELAKRLFAVASKGDKVVITRGARIGQGDTLL